jgi:5-(carboxyamino)imidazole ribonucleotide synthase
MLRCTVAPAETSSAQQHGAQDMLGAIMRELNYVGVMAMELFDHDGQLLVNELAPRVHNSGHWSQSGAGVDQFELHLRALCGLPSGDLAPRGVTAMINLVGNDFDPRWLGVPGGELHWYGKTPAPGRKLGHLNLNANRPAELAGMLERLLPLLDPAHVQAARHALAQVVEHGQTPGARGKSASDHFNLKQSVQFAS